MSDEEPTWKSSLPFPRRWLYYFALKLAVIAIAAMIVLRVMGYV
jgi:hypothetical protein